MAKNMCFAAQQALHESERRTRGASNFSPIAMTGKQSQIQDGGNTTRSNKVWTEIWKLKSQRPHLFPAKTAGAVLASTKPRGFEDTASLGWLYNSERGVFLETASGRCMWMDQEASVHRNLHEARNLSGVLALSGGAVGTAAQNGRQAKHVVIMDFHKAAEAFKIDLEHLDRPAAMLAVYGSAPGAVPAEVVSKSLHERLLRRFGGYRSEWSDQALEATLIEALATFPVEQQQRQQQQSTHFDGGVIAAVALVIGSRLVASASGGAACVVASMPGRPEAASAALAETGCSGNTLASVGSTRGNIKATCLDISGAQAAPCMLLHTDAMALCETMSSVTAAALAQAVKGRPRAAATALLHLNSPKERVAEEPRATACAHLSIARDGGPPAAKRRRFESSVGGGSGVGSSADNERVRCRRILLKYIGCRKPTDEVRRRPIRRSLNRAADELLGVIAEVDAGGDAAFVRQCRIVSECISSLKGGDLVGDVGWWTRPVEKPGEKISRETASKHALINVAFLLEVGEVSDIIISDDGVQILQRRA